MDPTLFVSFPPLFSAPVLAGGLGWLAVTTLLADRSWTAESCGDPYFVRRSCP